VKSRRTAVLALTALAASGCGVGVHFADYRHTVTPADTHLTAPVSEIQVSSDSGHVTVTSGGDGVTIHRVVHYESGTPHPGQRISGGTLTFSKGCSRCSVDYDLTVPASVRVHAHTDSGRVEITGVMGAEATTDSGRVTVRHIKDNVSAHSDSGSVTVEDIGGAFNAGTDSGSILGTALRSATARATSGSGSVRLQFTGAPNGVHANTDSGSIRLVVPGGPYAIDARDSSAPRKLYLRSDSGNLTVVPPTG
jgi:Putative adhesin